MHSSASTPDSTPSTRDGSPGSVTLQMKQHYALANQRTPPTPDVRLYHRAVVVAQDTPGLCEASLLLTFLSCRRDGMALCHAAAVFWGLGLHIVTGCALFCVL